MPLEDAIKSIKAGLTAQQQKLHRLLLERLEKDFKQQTELFNPHDHLFFLIKGELAHIESLDIGNRQFNTNFSRAVTGAEKKRHLLNYATHLGSNLKQVRQDRKALKRWLWHDTLQERYYRRRAKTEQRIVFWLTALGSIKSSLDLWKAVENQQLLLQLLSPTLDYRVAEAALKATAENLARIPSINVETLFNADFQKKVYHLSLDDNQVVWLRYQALSLLKIINHVTFVEVVKVVLRNRRGASSSTNKHAGMTAVQEAPGDVSSLNKKSESNHAVPGPARGDDHFFLRRR
ncbi:MAG: hypothetical protein GY757_54490, partial [bacterium]|nr:hypothetical protein [bacterium]